ncbi:MAG: hypothetical protein ACPGSC_02330 [Granulosicoccaceae bacterium]
MQRVSDVGRAVFERVFAPFGLTLRWHTAGAAIPGTYWGEPEAGLIADVLHARDDTPVQSVLHEGCHWVCMTPKRRQKLHTNVGGSLLEECGVCYLQILLARDIRGVGEERLLADMDAWGYSFRTGSAASWFKEDAEDARAWLLDRGLLCASSGRVLVPS